MKEGRSYDVDLVFKGKFLVKEISFFGFKFFERFFAFTFRDGNDVHVHNDCKAVLDAEVEPKRCCTVRPDEQTRSSV